MDPLTTNLMRAAGSLVATPTVLQSGVTNASSINFTSTPAANTLILFFGQRSGSDVSLPTGYTLIAQRTGTNCRFLCAYKVAAGNETSAASANASMTGYAVVSVGALLDTTGTVATSNTVNGITPASSSLAFLVIAANNSATSVSQDGSGWTEVFNSVTGLVSGNEIVLWSKPGAGTATGTVTITIDTSPTAGVQFSVK